MLVLKTPIQVLQKAQNTHNCLKNQVYYPLNQKQRVISSLVQKFMGYALPLNYKHKVLSILIFKHLVHALPPNYKQRVLIIMILRTTVYVLNTFKQLIAECSLVLLKLMEHLTIDSKRIESQAWIKMELEIGDISGEIEYDIRISW